MCSEYGIKHLRIDISGANQRTLKDQFVLHEVKTKCRELLTIMKNQSEVIVIHCAAGLHRTGSIGYALVRLGSDPVLLKEDAYLALKTMREETYERVKDWRIVLAEDNIVQPLFEELNEEQQR